MSDHRYSQIRFPVRAVHCRAAQAGLTVAGSAGSVTFWDGSTWHSRYRRTVQGQQVVVYVTYNRLAMRPKESNSHLDENWLARKPFAMRVLLGREDGMDTAQGVVGSIDNLGKRS